MTKNWQRKSDKRLAIEKLFIVRVTLSTGSNVKGYDNEGKNDNEEETEDNETYPVVFIYKFCLCIIEYRFLDHILSFQN